MEETKIVSESVAFEETLKYFRGDELATKVWLNKYALRNLEGQLLEEYPTRMHLRITNELSRIENKYPNPMGALEIFDMLQSFKYFIPGGSSMFGIGNNYSISSLGNCFVVGDTEDSYASILKIDAEQVQIMKRRGGVGHDLSHLRPKGAFVSNAAKTSSGIIPFMSRYSNTTQEVAQEGRRGALMLTLNVNHPEIEEFITTKDDLSKINGANISVKITDEFMEAVENDQDFNLYFHNDDKYINRIVKARNIWDKIIHQAWKTAEPGVLFWDKIIKESPADCYGDFQTVSTNPCGELPLCTYDSCRLGSINLFSFVDNPFTMEASFDFGKLGEIVIKSQRLMDDIVDLEEEKITRIINKIGNVSSLEGQLWYKIRYKLLRGRRTGLGVTGLADMLAALGYKYDSNPAIEFCGNLFRIIAKNSYYSSIQMAKERGAFPEYNYHIEKENPFIQRVINQFHMEEDGVGNMYKLYGRRNIANLTIAPNGTIGIMCQGSSGVEPVFMLSYTRRRKVNFETNYQDDNGQYWEENKIFHRPYKQYAETDNHFEMDPYFKATANEIEPLQKVKLQGAIQKWIDHSISVTHNLPANITEKEVSDIYMHAWKQGCKGVTIYREGCRTGVLVSNDKIENTEFKQTNAPKRPKSLTADIKTTIVKGEQWLVIVGLYEGKPYEVFALPTFKSNIELRGKYVGEITKKNQGRYDLIIKDNSTIENFTDLMTFEENNTTRLVSTALRHGADIRFVVEQLNKTKGDITTFAKALARTLKTYIPDGVDTKKHCPECGNGLTYKDGCESCLSCGYSKCG